MKIILCVLCVFFEFGIASFPYKNLKRMSKMELVSFFATSIAKILTTFIVVLGFFIIFARVKENISVLKTVHNVFFGEVSFILKFFPGMDVDQLFFTVFAPKTGISNVIVQTSIIMLLVIPLTIAIFNFTLKKLKLKMTLNFAIRIEKLLPLSIRKKAVFSFILCIFALTVLFLRFPILEFIKR